MINLRGLRTAAAYFSFFFIFGAFLLGTLWFVGSDSVIMSSLFSRLSSYQAAGITESASDETARAIGGYLRGNTDKLSLVTEINGQTAEFFEEKSAAHMVDVRALFFLCAKVALISALVGVLLLLSLKPLKAKRLNVGKGMLCAGLSWLLLLLLLLAVCLIDFTTAFEAFHRVFFTNDLWLLSAKTSALIRIMPEKLFVYYGAILLLALCAGLAALLISGSRIWSKARAELKKSGEREKA
ncbi:MAG: TIGR01906 family membrane protein [Eubacteriales bacterium]|nr:TIGR01906 family membrane protein [Eubacteriales bacterium]MDD3882418.1 TIGR01906 family membrane protein [Eubacteriales bacterium]MDD4513799.1 TIGR01906 family membrane protein [Eubacteriales bacterium]